MDGHVSDPDTVDSRTSTDDTPDALKSGRPEREGLPRGYRMRADSHYVEHLMAQADAQPVRMIPIEQISSGPSPDQGVLRPLIESIRSHGIVQPVLVRRTETGSYAVIAGHKRLAAAKWLRHGNVPCLVHSVDPQHATMLSRAEGLRVGASSEPAASAMIDAIHQTIAQHLAAVQTITRLIATTPSQLAGAAIELSAAHAWRAARLLDVIRATGPAPAAAPRARSVSLSSVIDRVVEGFAPEIRLSGIDVTARVKDPSGTLVAEHDVALIVSAAMLATIWLVEYTADNRRSILVSASTAEQDGIRIVVAHGTATVSADLAVRFFEQETADRPDSWCAACCARTVKLVAERLGGTARFEVDSQREVRTVVKLPAGISSVS